jgi:hypothetical protein
MMNSLYGCLKQTKMSFFQKQMKRMYNSSWLVSVEGGRYKEKVKLGNKVENYVLTYENGKIRPLDTIL